MTQLKRENRPIVSRSRFIRGVDAPAKEPFPARTKAETQPEVATASEKSEITPRANKGEDAESKSDFVPALAPVAAEFEEPPVNEALGTDQIRLIVLGAVAVVLCVISYFLGAATSSTPKAEIAMPKAVIMPPETAVQLDEAYTALREGKATSVEQFLALEKIEPAFSSMSYLVALSALQNGDFELALKKVAETQKKGERLSDSLVLEAVLETQMARGGQQMKMTSTPIRVETLLRQAILADPANPYPYFELATLLRRAGRTEEALAAIRSAELRLNPVDSHLTMGVTGDLAELEMKTDGALPDKTPLAGDVRGLFPMAYVAMRRGDFGKAAEILQQCRGLMTVDAFDYLVNDPAIRKYRNEAHLAEFYAR